ncbi:MAG: hypothetical protein PHV55_02250 [Candidatus Omnitrophica bacterium]|nr:hypothetical protein [Candidatus Omnitrophota bacterium]
MKKRWFFCFPIPLIIISGIFLPSAFSASETITISTYYPAPYGVYEELRAQRVAIGEDYLDGSQYCWSPNTCTEQINATTTDLVVQGNVGIGTVMPAQKLHIYKGGMILDAGESTSSGQAALNMITEGDGEKDLNEASTKGWHLAARGAGYTGDATQQNDFGLWFWNGTSWFSRMFIEHNNTGNMGIGTTTPRAKLHVAGEAVIGNSGLACTNTTAGAMRYNSGSKTMQYCDGARWDSIGQPAIYFEDRYNDVSTGSVNFVDMPGMSITNDFAAGNIYISFTGQIRDDGATWNYQRILVDNNEVYRTYKQDFTGAYCSNHDALGFPPVSINVVKPVAAGRHTIKVQWRIERDSGSGKAYQDGACSPRQLIVIQ